MGKEKNQMNKDFEKERKSIGIEEEKKSVNEVVKDVARKRNCDLLIVESCDGTMIKGQLVKGGEHNENVSGTYRERAGKSVSASVVSKTRKPIEDLASRRKKQKAENVWNFIGQEVTQAGE